MLEDLRVSAFSEVAWNTKCDTQYKEEAIDAVHLIECERYEGINEVRDGINYSSVKHAQQPRDQAATNGGVESQLDDWLQRTGSYQPLRPAPTGKRVGSLRIVLCDRPDMIPGMTMSEVAFRTIERCFKLDAATLPALLLKGGAQRLLLRRDSADLVSSMSIVIKVPQKRQVSNCLLSLRYEVATAITNVFLCGAGLTSHRPPDNVCGSQMEQLISAIKANIQHWHNPLLLPTLVLQLCIERTRRWTSLTEKVLVQTEKDLGVTYIGCADFDFKTRPGWPHDIDVKASTLELHSLAPQITFLLSNCEYMNRLAAFLLSCDQQISTKPGIAGFSANTTELGSSLLFLASVNEGLIEAFKILKDRMNSQINLLFNVVGQQDGYVNRMTNELNIAIARSTKQDSISMSTFTFITALFLPGSSIATMFSMSMFNWQPDDNIQSFNGYVSSMFWLYWAIVVPLTFLTLAGRYAWYRYVKGKHQRSLAPYENVISKMRQTNNLEASFATKSKPAKIARYGRREHEMWQLAGGRDYYLAADWS